MKRKHLRIISLVFAMAIMIAVFAGCKTNDDKETGGSTTPVLEALDFGGYEITFTSGGDYLPPADGNSSLAMQWKEELYALEDRINVVFKQTELTAGLQELLTSGLAGEKIADVLKSTPKDFFASALQNYIVAVDSDEMIGYGLDCYDENRWLQKEGTLGSILQGKAYGLNIGNQYRGKPHGYVVMFNPIICADAGYPDMYQLVRDRKWNWDVYNEIADSCAKDNTGDGINDVWGTGATGWGTETLCNDSWNVNEKDGRYVSFMDTPETLEALEFLARMNYSYTRHLGTSGEARSAFADGFVAFNWESGFDAGATAAQGLFDFGVLPAPMGRRATEYASPTFSVDMMVFQSSNKELPKIVQIMNEFASVFNNDRWIEKFDDGRLRTDQDREMFNDYILESFRMGTYSKMTESVWQYVDGLFSLVSYNGESPSTAVEDYNDALNDEINSFLGQ